MIAATLLPGAARGELPCAGDIAKFCAKVPQGGGRIQACLQKHEKQLSPACRARYKHLEQEMGGAAASCRFDISRFCSDVAPGGGRVAACLQGHADDLSPVCKERLQKIMQPPHK